MSAIHQVIHAMSADVYWSPETIAEITHIPIDTVNWCLRELEKGMLVESDKEKYKRHRHWRSKQKSLFK